MNWDEIIEEEIKNNTELKKIFEKHPERKELYKQKMIDSHNESSGQGQRNPKFCKTCIFANGDPPFADLPDKAYCMIYTHENGVAKPKSVYFDGAICEYYNDGKEDTANE